MKKDKFSIGEKVFLIHLNQEAEIKRVINSDLIYVDVDGMEIPVFTSDLTAVTEHKPLEKIIHAEQSINDFKKPAEEKITATNKGVFICFEPESDKQGDIISFNIFMINDTDSAVDFSYRFDIRDQTHFSLKRLMIPYNYLLLHTIEYDLLNEMPAVTLEVRDVMNKTFTGTLIQKIKAQNFFNKLADTPLLQKQGYNYKVNLKSSVPKREAVKERVRFDAELLKQMMMDVPAVKDDSIESPVIEIDLHIEKLAGDHARLNPGDILNIQVRAFQQALERAIVHRADRLYAIHGIGTGKLKNEIHRLLKTYKEIRSFNNDYHPRYGYGATEIILR